MLPTRRTQGLLLLLAVAFALRAALVVGLSIEHRAPLTYEHGEIAENLLTGRGFSVRFLGLEGPTSQQAPLYPVMLAGVYAVLGVGTSASILAMQLLQCAAGAAIPLAVVWLSWSLVPGRPLSGWLAGWGAALYPPHVYMATHIQVVPWSTLVLALLTALVLSDASRRFTTKAILAGLLSGVLLLLDPILALALPILAVAMFLQFAPPRRAVRAVSLMAATSLLVIAPWLVRNAKVHGELVFIKSTFGYAFWQGNNSYSWGTDKVPKPSAELLRRDHDGTLAGVERALWEARHETIYIDDLLLKPSGYREFAGLSEPQRSRLLGQRAWQFLQEHPARYAALCLARLRYFLLFDETNPKAANPVYRGSILTWMALTLLGLAAWRFDRQQARRVWPLAAIFLTVTLFHVLTISSARFRIPLEPLTFVWCGWGLAIAVHGFFPRFALSQHCHAVSA